MHHCSLLIQAALSAPRHVVAEISSRIRHARSIRSAQRKFIGHLARQLLRWRWQARIVHRRRYLRTRIARGCFLRRFGRMPRRCRRNFWRFDWHQGQRRRCGDVPCLWQSRYSFAHDLRANALRLSRGKTGAHFSGSCVNGNREPAACCCGSCRSRHSHGRACRRYSLRATRFWRDARSPPRAATASAARP
jgi:hypothetical protein